MKKDNNMNNPKISVVTVVYNDVDHIESTIKSVISQTYPHIEYIVIDGGSTDGTVDIIKKYKNSIAYFISEKDNGIYDAMNQGIEYANGKFVCFLNCGDFFADNKGKSLEEAIKCWKYKKQLRGHNCYERKDLIAIEEKSIIE